MATYGVTDEGFILKPRDVIVTELNNAYIGEFGSSFDVSPSSPDGQHIGIMADLVYGCWLREEAAYNQFIPSKVSNQGLDELVELNNVQRIIDQPTTVVCQLTGTGGTIVPAGSTVETIEGLQFTTNTTITLPDETTCTCTTLGALPINPNEVVVISEGSEVVGWTGVDNSAEGITGIVRQTDPELRALRENRTISTGVHTTDAIRQAVASLNLEFIYIVDNTEDVTLPSGQVGNSIAVTVEGGNPQEIAQKIYDNMPAGIPTWGSETAQAFNSLGDSFDIDFSRPTDVNIEVNTNITIAAGSLSNTDELVQQAIIDYIDSLNIGTDVDWSSLFCPILTVQGVAVASLTIAYEGGVHGTVPLVIGDIEKAATSTLLVTVTEV